MIPRSRRNLFSFGENDNAGTKAGKSHAGGAFSFPSLANHDIFKDYLYVFIGSRVQDARKSPIFVKPKLSISNVNAISDDEVTNCPYCHELVLK